MMLPIAVTARRDEMEGMLLAQQSDVQVRKRTFSGFCLYGCGFHHNFMPPVIPRLSSCSGSAHNPCTAA